MWILKCIYSISIHLPFCIVMIMMIMFAEVHAESAKHGHAQSHISLHVSTGVATICKTPTHKQKS